MAIKGLNPDSAINPSEAQVQTFLSHDHSDPITFINAHEYHDTARYPEGSEALGIDVAVSGQEAYHRYLAIVINTILPHIPGAKITAIPCELVMVGSANWHELVIGCYPSRTAILQLSEMPGYAEAVIHRDAGLKAVETIGIKGNLFTDFRYPAFSSKSP